MNNELYHANGRSGWAKKNAKYISRSWKNGKWVYVYPGQQRSRATGNTGVKGAQAGASQRATHKTAPKKYNAIQKLLGVDKRDAYRNASSAHNAAKKLASSGNHDKAQRYALSQNVNRTYNNYNKAAKAYKSTPLGALDSAGSALSKKLNQGRAHLSSIVSKTKKKLNDTSVVKAIKKYQKNIKLKNMNKKSAAEAEGKANATNSYINQKTRQNKNLSVQERLELENDARKAAALRSQAQRNSGKKVTTPKSNTSYGANRAKVNNNIRTESQNREAAIARQQALKRNSSTQNTINSNIELERRNREAAQRRNNAQASVRSNAQRLRSETNRQRTQSAVDERIELERRRREAAQRRARAARKN